MKIQNRILVNEYSQNPEYRCLFTHENYDSYDKAKKKKMREKIHTDKQTNKQTNKRRNSLNINNRKIYLFRLKRNLEQSNLTNEKPKNKKMITIITGWSKVNIMFSLIVIIITHKVRIKRKHTTQILI